MPSVLCRCGQPAEFGCTWPTRRFRYAQASEAREGDLTANVGGTRAGEVMSIQATLGGWLRVTIAKVIMRKGVVVTHEDGDFAWDGTQKQYEWAPQSPIQILVQMPCGRAVCSNHVRDLGDDKHYICSEHWSAQMEMIA